MTKENAYILTDMLRTVTVGSEGTGRAARITGIDVAAKTGTTSDDKDRWFTAYTPYYVGAVWFGYDTPKTVVVYGGNPALNLWKKVMTKIHSGLASKTFTRPSNVGSAYICVESGELAGEECKSILEFFAKGKAPSVTCDGTKHKVNEEGENLDGETNVDGEEGSEDSIEIPPDSQTPENSTKPSYDDSESIDLDSIL